MKLVPYKELAPSFWSPYLVNGDDSGLDDADKQAALDWITGLGYSTPVDSEAYGVGKFNGMLYDLAEYTFLQNEEPADEGENLMYKIAHGINN